MQTRMKERKPYLLNLIDLGEKEKERDKETKASVNEQIAMQCSTAHSKGEKKNHLYRIYSKTQNQKISH